MLHDTLALQLHIDDLALPGNEDFDWSEDHVKSLITQAMATTDQELEAPMQFREFLCAQMSKEKQWTNVAYIECSNGYFFITEALAEYLTVVYSRWD